MKRKTVQGLCLWLFEQLCKETGVKHFVTGRQSPIGGEAFTLSYSGCSDRETITRNRELLATVMGIPTERLYFPSQVHETKIVHVTRATSVTELQGTDALVTQELGYCISVMSADCVPILLYDRYHRAVAAVHSGWRGTVSRILEKTLHRMQSLFGSHGKDILACIGPSICRESYEVGAEVVDAVIQAFGNHHNLIVPTQGDKALFDLWEANTIQLLEFGVPPSQIERAGLCTYKNNDAFFSARKGDRGRFAAGIMLV